MGSSQTHSIYMNHFKLLKLLIHNNNSNNTPKGTNNKSKPTVMPNAPLPAYVPTLTFPIIQETKKQLNK